LSHRFHGKGPGKKKIEKNLKKIEQEEKLKMGGNDSLLRKLDTLEQRQKNLGEAGVTIQVGNNKQFGFSISFFLFLFLFFISFF